MVSCIVLCCVVLCCVVLCCVVLCCVVLCCIVLCCVVLCCIVLCCVVLCCVVLCCVVLCCVVLCCVVLCCVVLCCVVLCCVVLCCVVLCCVVLCCVVLCCAALWCGVAQPPIQGETVTNFGQQFGGGGGGVAQFKAVIGARVVLQTHLLQKFAKKCLPGLCVCKPAQCRQPKAKPVLSLKTKISPAKTIANTKHWGTEMLFASKVRNWKCTYLHHH